MEQQYYYEFMIKFYVINIIKHDRYIRFEKNSEAGLKPNSRYEI